MRVIPLLVISLICICIIYIRNTFDGLYGSGCIQKINYRYELFMTDSVRGFLIDNLSGKSIPIANPSFEGNIIYGECESDINGNKYFIVDVYDNTPLQLVTKNKLQKILRSHE